MRARRREGSQPLPSPYFWPRAHLREPELAAVQSEVAAPTARALTFLSRFSDPGSAPLSEHDRRPHRFRCGTDFRMRADRWKRQKRNTGSHALSSAANFSRRRTTHTRWPVPAVTGSTPTWRQHWSVPESPTHAHPGPPAWRGRQQAAVSAARKRAPRG